MRICIVPEYPMSLMEGGLQEQAMESYRALVAKGADVELFNWCERKPLADIYHFMGFPPYLSKLMELVYLAGRPYVITMLFGARKRVMLAAIRQRLKSQVLRQRSRYDAVMRASAIVTNLEKDADAASLVYGVDRKRISVVLNGVTDNFFNARPDVWQQQFGDKPFVLSVGAIQPRKNQLLLLQACNSLRLPVVLLGPILPGCQDYGNKIAVEANINKQFGGQWLTTVRNEDALMPSAFSACRLFALISDAETQPLSVMQAMAARKPILLMKSNYVTHPLFCKLPLITSHEVGAVAEAIKVQWEKGTPSDCSRDLTWGYVAEQLMEIYKQIKPVSNR